MNFGENLKLGWFILWVSHSLQIKRKIIKIVMLFEIVDLKKWKE